jgi:hypothetical protein
VLISCLKILIDVGGQHAKHSRVHYVFELAVLVLGLATCSSLRPPPTIAATARRTPPIRRRFCCCWPGGAEVGREAIAGCRWSQFMHKHHLFRNGLIVFTHTFADSTTLAELSLLPAVPIADLVKLVQFVSDTCRCGYRDCCVGQCLERRSGTNAATKLHEVKAKVVSFSNSCRVDREQRLADSSHARHFRRMPFPPSRIGLWGRTLFERPSLRCIAKLATTVPTRANMLRTLSPSWRYLEHHA